MSSTNPGPATTTGANALGGGSPMQIGTAATSLVGFYGTTPAVQRASSNQVTTNIAVSASFGASQLAVIQEIMNTLAAVGLWKGAA